MTLRFLSRWQSSRNHAPVERGAGPAGASSRGTAAVDPAAGPSMPAALALLDEIVDCTRSSVESLDAGAQVRALELLRLREESLARLGEVLSQLPGGEPTSAEADSSAEARQAALDRILLTAMELGRLDAHLAGRFGRLPGGAGSTTASAPPTNPADAASAA